MLVTDIHHYILDPELKQLNFYKNLIKKNNLEYFYDEKPLLNGFEIQEYFKVDKSEIKQK